MSSLCYLKALLLLGVFINRVNNILCAFCMFFNYATTMCAFHLTILFGLDKCLAVNFPFAYRQYGKPKACVISTIVVYILVGFYNLYALFVFRIDPESGDCRPYDFSIIGTVFFYEIRPYTSSALVAFIPFVLSAIITTLTVLKIKMMARKRSATQNRDQSKAPVQSRRDSEITQQMIVVCALFCMLSIVNTTLTQVVFSIDIKTAREQMIVTLLDRIMSNSIAMINSANFYVYILFGKKFRANFVSLFTRDKTFGQITRSQQRSGAVGSWMRNERQKNEMERSTSLKISMMQICHLFERNTRIITEP